MEMVKSVSVVSKEAAAERERSHARAAWLFLLEPILLSLQ